MRSLRLLDAFCCQGGASKGYEDAGFTEIVGVDIDPQPKYPYTFVQDDAVAYIREHGHEFDAIHASPPCQAYSKTQRIRSNDHPDLIGPTRSALIEAGKPYVIENVMDARDELRDPVMLCGAMFPQLRSYRHRLFEASFPLWVPEHPKHTAKQAKMGRPPKDGEFIHAVGNFSGVDFARDALEVWWMNRDGIRECIPPAYAEFIGEQLIAHMDRPMIIEQPLDFADWGDGPPIRYGTP